MSDVVTTDGDDSSKWRIPCPSVSRCNALTSVVCATDYINTACK